MAHYGGGPPTSPPPRVHRPRAPTMSLPPPLTAPLAPLRPPPPVSLTSPRPENERSGNEYVEAPFRNNPTVWPPLPTRTDSPPTIQRPSHLQMPLSLPITKQPQTGTFIKGRATPGSTPECISQTSIMCQECGRCKCESCQQPRPLPEKWLCDNKCLCSADACIDYISCLCCVKGLFYHCGESDGGESCADDPCGCGADRRTARWGCMAALSCVLPCLWCYWPLRACKSVVEACYSRHSRQGCRCRPPQASTEKRLLEPSPDH